jgi:carboxypeptidase C (cathepsin A)
VGFSYSNDANFSYNDISTSEDNMAALLSFFTGFPEYADSPFWIAGESYAGKYIPDLSVLIDFYNNKGVGKKINLKGIMVGNGIMTF